MMGKQNLPSWDADDFKLIVFKKQKTGEKPWPSLATSQGGGDKGGTQQTHDPRSL